MEISNATATPDTPALGANTEYDAVIAGYLSEMENMKAEMDERQKRIESSRAETDAMLTSLLADLKDIAA